MKLFIGFLACLGALTLIILLLFLFCCLVVGKDDSNDE